MAKGKASKEGNDIGVDLASNIAKALNRVLGTYDFTPLNKNLVKGIGKIDISSLLRSDNAKIKQLAIDVRGNLEKGIGDITITPNMAVDQIELPAPDINPFLDVADAQEQVRESASKQALDYSKINTEQIKQIPRGEEILKLLKQAKLEHKDIDTLIGAISNGEYKVVEAHKNAQQVLTSITDESRLQKTLNDTILQQAISRRDTVKQQNAAAQELTAEDQKQYKLLGDTLIARELLVDAAENLVDTQGNQLDSGRIITNLLEDELDLSDSLAASYGLTGKAAQYAAEKIKEGIDPAEILKSTELEAVNTMQKSIEVRKKVLEAQGEGVLLDKELQTSYENSNKLLIKHTIYYTINTIYSKKPKDYALNVVTATS